LRDSRCGNGYVSEEVCIDGDNSQGKAGLKAKDTTSNQHKMMTFGNHKVSFERVSKVW
jgi:hypothetical protein